MYILIKSKAAVTCRFSKEGGDPPYWLKNKEIDYVEDVFDEFDHRAHDFANYHTPKGKGIQLNFGEEKGKEIRLEGKLFREK